MATTKYIEYHLAKGETLITRKAYVCDQIHRYARQYYPGMIAMANHYSQVGINLVAAGYQPDYCITKACQFMAAESRKGAKE